LQASAAGEIGQRQTPWTLLSRHGRTHPSGRGGGLRWCNLVARATAWPEQSTAFVDLSYPKDALDGRVQGTVILSVTTDANGRVTDVQRLAGPTVLATAAAANARQWTLALRGRSDALVYRFRDRVRAVSG
jgi:hypothetical protein